MNERAVEVLVKAAMDGVRQIRGEMTDPDGGRCALGALGFTNTSSFAIALMYGMSFAPMMCPECSVAFSDEIGLIAHLNDFHGWDFLTIARKLGPTA